MRRVLYFFCFSLLFCFSTSLAVAQGDEAENAIKAIDARAEALVKQTMDVASTRAASFNEQMRAVNLLRPLDVASLDSQNIVHNVGSIESFLTYLMRYRDSSTIFLNRFQDSLGFLREELPDELKPKYLKGFEEAYKADIKAFDNYTLELSTLFRRVLSVLEYLRTEKYAIHEGRLEFAAPDGIKKYLRLTANVDAAAKRVAKASDASQQATAWANKTVKQAYEE